MKKEYKKPELLFDSFELSTSIATGCADKIREPINKFGKVIFTSYLNCTDVPTTDDEAMYGICYHNPTDLTRMFTS